MHWDTITDLILLAALATGAVFGILGLKEWITRKNFQKIDPELRWALVPLSLLAVTYLVFDHLLIWNTRPDGSGEPSFPSSHVMCVATIFALTALILPRYLKNRPARIAADLLMLILTVLVSVGRVLADKHWPSDVAGALVFSAIFAAIYYIIIKRSTHHA